MNTLLRLISDPVWAAMTTCKLVIALLMGVLTSTALYAGSPPTPDSLLSAYIREAWDRHPDIIAMRAMAQADSNQALMSRGWMNPELRAGLMNAPDNFETNTDPMTMFQIGIMQRIPSPGRLTYSGAARDAEARASRVGVEGGKLEMASMITMLYYDLSAAICTRGILARGQQLANQMRDAAAFMAAAGMESQATVRRSLLEAEEWRLKRVENETVIARKRAQLAYSMGRGETVSIADPVLPEGLPVDSLPDLEGGDSQLAETPELRQARLRLEAAQLDVRRARLSYWPDIEVMLAYGLRRDLHTDGTDPMTGTPVQGKTNQDNMVTVELSFPLPLFYRRNQQPEIAETKAMQRKQENAVKALELSKLRELQEIRLRYEQIRDSYLILKESVLPQAVMVWQAALEDYRNGRVNYMQLAESRMNTVMTEMRSVMLRAEAWSLWCQYNFALGRTLGIQEGER